MATNVVMLLAVICSTLALPRTCFEYWSSLGTAGIHDNSLAATSPRPICWPRHYSWLASDGPALLLYAAHAHCIGTD